MKKYFYSNGKEKNGPFTLEELKDHDINGTTLIWFEGLKDWTPAKDIQDMNPILELLPPPLFAGSSKSDILNKTTEAIDNKWAFENDSIGMSKTLKDQPATKDDTKRKEKQSMFSSPFSFEGRIRRTEYGISFLLVFISYIFLNEFSPRSGGPGWILLFNIPLYWFLWAQGAKRCHDVGQNGWYQIIPFYVLYLIFAEGEKKINSYGPNPKG